MWPRVDHEPLWSTCVRWQNLKVVRRQGGRQTQLAGYYSTGKVQSDTGVGKHYIGPVIPVDQLTGSLSASFKKIARLVGRLRSGPRLVVRIGSQEYGLVPVLEKCPHHRSVRVRTPPRGRQGRCSAGQYGGSTLAAGRQGWQGRCSGYPRPSDTASYFVLNNRMSCF